MSGLVTTVLVGGRPVRVDLRAGWDLAIELDFDGPQPNAFYLPAARAAVVEADGFVGDTTRGGGANCRTVELNPHGNGTHTESVSHIVDELVPVADQVREPLMAALVVTVAPVRLADTPETYAAACHDDDQVVTRAALEAAAAAATPGPTGWPATALAIRTQPNPASKRHRRWSGQNPAYLTAEAMAWVRSRGVEHLLVDLPSVDREEDEGLLPNHHAFWQVDAGSHTLAGQPPRPYTITEMVYVDDQIADGPWLLNLQVPRFALDAAPSRPLLFGPVLDAPGEPG